MTKKTLRKVNRKVSPLVLAGVSLPLLATQVGLAQSTSEPVQLKPVIVTGSAIPTAETITPAPLERYTAQDIEKTGYQDVLQALRAQSTIFQGSGNFGQFANNITVATGAIPAGEAYISIRNLPTLVLVDGRRMANSALSAGQFVDLNTIPVSAIERVEVLKDGASAIYGSDAIGGVVNIIMKKDWNGAEIQAHVGFPTDKTSNDVFERRFSVVAGTANDESSFIAGASYYFEDPLLTKDRPRASASIDSLAAVDVSAPSYFSPSFPGRVQSGGVSYILAGSPLAVGAPGYNPAITKPVVLAGDPEFTTVPAYNAMHPGIYIPLSTTPGGIQSIAQGFGDLTPELNTTQFGTYSFLQQDRRNAFANFERDLIGKNVRFFGSILYANDLSQAALAPSPAPDLAGSGITVPANNPFNPFHRDLGYNGAGTPRVRYRFIDFGNRIFDAQTDYYRLIGGLKGEITPEYNYETAYTYNRTDQTYFTRNAINGAGLNLALQPDLAADPTGALSKLKDSNGNSVPTFNIFALPGTGANSQATIDALRTTLYQSGTSELWSYDGVIRGTPHQLELPAGPVAFAVGGQYTEESLRTEVDGLTQLGFVPGLNAAFPFSGGTRTRGAGFIEVNVPIFSEANAIPGFRALEFQLAGRIEDIQPGGTSAVPKLGLKWQPLDEQVTIRGGYSEGFVAPSIYSLFGPDSVSNPTIPIAGQVGQVTTQTKSNPNLPASDSRNWNIGIVYSPKQIPNLTMSADYYNIELNKIAVADPVAAAQSLNTLGPASPYFGGFSTADGTVIDGPNQVNVGNWGNLILPTVPTGALRTDGMDFAINYSYPTDAWGKLTANASVNWVFNYEFQNDPTLPFYHYEGLYTGGWGGSQGLIPDFQLSAGLTYEFMDFTYNVYANYLPSSTDIGFLHPYVGDVAHGLTLSGNPYTLPDYYTIGMSLSYEFGKKGTGKWYDHTKVTVGANNLLDEVPPFVPSATEDNTDKSIYDIWGRFVYFELSKKF